MAKTHRCYCSRCHGKLVCKSTFYNHNPRGTGRKRSGPYAKRAVDTSPRDTPMQGSSPPNTSAPGPSMDVISDEDADHPDGGRVYQPARSDAVVCTMANLIYTSELTNSCLQNDIQGPEYGETRPQTPQSSGVLFDDEHTPPSPSTPRALSPPLPPPLSPVPPGFDESPTSSG